MIQGKEVRTILATAVLITGINLGFDPPLTRAGECPPGHLAVTAPPGARTEGYNALCRAAGVSDGCGREIITTDGLSIYGSVLTEGRTYCLPTGQEGGVEQTPAPTFVPSRAPKEDSSGEESLRSCLGILAGCFLTLLFGKLKARRAGSFTG